MTADAPALDLATVRVVAEDQGWSIGINAHGDLLFNPPSSASGAVYGSGAPDDRRAQRNLLAQLRLRGLLWPWPDLDTRRTEH